MLSSEHVPGFALSYIQKRPDYNAYPYATLDSGKTFFPIPMKNSQHFAFLSSGDVLVDYGASRTSVSFSFDRGHCWYNYSLFDQFDSRPQSERLILATNPLNEKHDSIELIELSAVNDFMSLGLAAFNALVPVRKMQVKSYIIDMKKISEAVQTCQDDNTHIEKGEECMLGRKHEFKRPKEGAETCRMHGGGIEEEHSPCSCTDADYECDFGFEPDEKKRDQLVCLPYKSEKMNLTSVCYHKLYEQHQKYFNTTGYRKVAGDECQGGKESDFDKKEIHSFEILCTDEDYLTSKMEAQMYVRPNRGTGGALATVFGFLLVIIILIAVVLAAVYIVKVKRYELPFNFNFRIPSFDSFRSNFSFSKFQNESV